MDISAILFIVIIGKGPTISVTDTGIRFDYIADCNAVGPGIATQFQRASHSIWEAKHVCVADTSAARNELARGE